MDFGIKILCDGGEDGCKCGCHEIHKADRWRWDDFTEQEYNEKSTRTPVDSTAIVSHNRGKIIALLGGKLLCGTRVNMFLY